MNSDESEDEKSKAKSKHKKSVDEDITEVTKNIKSVSISNKSQKKKAENNSEGNLVFINVDLQPSYTFFRVSRKHLFPCPDTSGLFIDVVKFIVFMQLQMSLTKRLRKSPRKRTKRKKTKRVLSPF